MGNRAASGNFLKAAWRGEMERGCGVGRHTERGGGGGVRSTARLEDGKAERAAQCLVVQQLIYGPGQHSARI
jgi:hypothetical protein